MVKLHKKLSSTAVRLSVYSALLDFGLTVSVLMKNKFLPAFLSNLFADAIAYLTVAIIVLFLLSFFLRSKEKIVNVYTTSTAKTNLPPHQTIPVSILERRHDEKPAIEAVVKVVPNTATSSDFEVQRFVNSKRQSFVKFNGLWYKYVRDQGSTNLERVRAPDYE